MNKRVLFCWENGEGSGHVVPYLALLESLKARGWETAVPARNTAEVGARVRASGAMLLQAPVCMAIFPELEAQSFSTTELLLQHGYGYEPTLNGIFSSWLGFMQTWQPDLVIGSGAPASHLAAQSLGIADIAIGSGFYCPVAVSPAPLIRPWYSGVEQRLAVSEDRALLTINAVMKSHGFARRQFTMDMYHNVPSLLCTFAELDHFGEFRRDASYLGMLPPVSASSVAAKTACAGEIFVYLRHNANIDPLLAALAKRDESTFVFMPNATPALRNALAKKFVDRLTFLESAVDIATVLPSAKLVVSNAGHNLTLQTLLAGCPLMLLPNHWEQARVAELAVKTGAAIQVLPTERNPKFGRLLDQLLTTETFRESATAFAERYKHCSPDAALSDAVRLCEYQVAKQSPRAPATRGNLMSVR
ncbi:MAG: hypothetical protein H7232_09250 [Aeromicrobium sp.]|nr:hypothetical protein [Burkholderiales bacterium]